MLVEVTSPLQSWLALFTVVACAFDLMMISSAVDTRGTSFRVFFLYTDYVLVSFLQFILFIEQLCSFDSIIHDRILIGSFGSRSCVTGSTSSLHEIRNLNTLTAMNSLFDVT